MMNNHFQTFQHEHTPQNVAPSQYLQHAAAATPTGHAHAATATTFSYMPQPAAAAAASTQLSQQQQQQPQQWMTYQILPPAMTIANGVGNKRYYATTTTTTAASNPNTIQITNNYAQQQQLTPTKQQPISATSSSPFKGNNIRIISATPNVFSLSKEQQQQLFTPSSTTTAELYAPVASRTLQSFYLPNAAGTVASSGNSLSHRLLTNNNNNNNTAKLLTAQPPPLVPVSSNNTINGNSASSTVVLDRINICINNHYSEAATPASLQSMQQQQPSPIIPAIQHKALMPFIDSSAADSSCSSSSGSGSLSRSAPSTAVIVIDEPDSTTTTPQTPPTTPETLSSPLKTPSVVATSPKATTSPKSPPSPSSTLLKCSLKQSFSLVAQSIEAVAPLTPPTPPTPPPPSPAATPTSNSKAVTYELLEDVFIKCNDGRFYLGTIIDQALPQSQYLVRFDDKSEQWCEPEKLRKLGGGNGSSNSQASSCAINSGPMCVACKREQQDDIVEICERCGRGYHRGCTTEIAPGSGIWCCKRCAKPMKMQQPLLDNVSKPAGICRQLPYHADKLSWDEKHRVNEEQIYCYCGKAGKFDHNMLQCCKCRNWFHTQCMQDFKRKLLRGDTFFVFCCTVCNDGQEFVRRLQIDWVDVLHITLYNLRKHQHQKNHHLLKDIWPFILEQRQQLPICAEWRALPETALMERIKHTLKEYSERFVCGREFKRAPTYYALRHSGPPLTPKVFLQPHEQLSDELLVNKFKLLLLPEPELDSGGGVASKDHTKDVYEFQTDEGEPDSSEDELPIKQMMEKVKKQIKPAPAAELELLEPTPDLADDNAHDGKLLADAKPSPVAASPSVVTTSSRKRKAFRLSKSYKEMAAKRYDSNRNCDLSSDENSSSSRGTSSLDLIIPPPVNFLGRNNPFLIATPKKQQPSEAVGRHRGVGVGNGVAGLINSIFNPKSTAAGGGIFPKLSNSELAKAAQGCQVRTIKRRLSAKDITIGPNQEVRRRRTRRLTTAVEVINTTTINPIPSHYFPIYAKDQQPQPPPKLLPPCKPTHGRLLRQRSQKSHGSPGNSRRSSTSSTATTGSSSTGAPLPLPTNNSSSSNSSSMLDLKQSVNKYFGGAMNRIDAGETFAIRAKRRIGAGHVQYLVEWGGDAATTTTAATTNASNNNNIISSN